MTRTTWSVARRRPSSHAPGCVGGSGSVAWTRLCSRPRLASRSPLRRRGAARGAHRLPRRWRATEAVGRLGPASFEVEATDRAYATRSATEPVHATPTRPRGRLPRRRRAADVLRRLQRRRRWARRSSTPRSGSTSRRWSTAARSSSGASRSAPATRSPPRPPCKEIYENGRHGLLRLRVGLASTRTATEVVRGDLDQHRAGECERAMSELEVGDPIPELRVTPDADLPNRYAGASGDFNPIHIDDEFAKSVGPARQHPPRPLLDGPGRPRAQRRRRRRPARAEAPRGPVPRHGRCPSRRSSSPARCTEADGGRGRDRHRRRPGRATRSSATPRPSSSSAESGVPARGRASAGPILESGCAQRAPTADPATGRRCLPRVRQARRLGVIAEGDESTGGRRRSAPSSRRSSATGFLTHPHTSAGRVPTDSGLPLLRRPAARRRRRRRRPAPARSTSRAMRREIDEAMRETASALSRMTDLLAVATAPPPSAAHDAPGRGAAAAAARR